MVEKKNGKAKMVKEMFKVLKTYYDLKNNITYVNILYKNGKYVNLHTELEKIRETCKNAKKILNNIEKEIVKQGFNGDTLENIKDMFLHARGGFDYISVDAMIIQLDITGNTLESLEKHINHFNNSYISTREHLKKIQDFIETL